MLTALWVEQAGDIIVARVRGKMTVELLRERSKRILQIAHDTGCRKLLLDDLELDPISQEAVALQQSLNEPLDALNFCIAVLVPNSRLAYLARVQFHGNNHRVFYNDMTAAVLWLSEQAGDCKP